MLFFQAFGLISILFAFQEATTPHRYLQVDRLQLQIESSKAEWHSHKDTQIVIKMVPPLHHGFFDWEPDGDSTLDEVSLGSSNKKQDFECAQEIQELDASQGSIKDIGNGCVLTTTFVPTGLDQFSTLQRRRNGNEHGLVLLLQSTLEDWKAHGSPQQLGSSSIQDNGHVFQRFRDCQVKMMEEGLKCGPYFKQQMKPCMRNGSFTNSGHEGLNAHWIKVQHVSVGKYVKHANQKLVEVNGMMMEQLPTRLVSIDVFVKLAKEGVKVSKRLQKELNLFYKMEGSRCQVGSEEANLVQLNLDLIHDVKVKLTSVGLTLYKLDLTLYKLQCEYLVGRLQEIECILKQYGSSTSKGQCDILLKEVYCFVEEANQILQESCQYKSWMLIAIFFIIKVQAIHHMIFYLIGCVNLLLRALPMKKQNKIPELELEREEIGISFAEVRSSKPQTRDVQSLEQIALEDHNALVEKLECHEQGKELDDGDLLHLPILVVSPLGPHVHCDVHFDNKTLLGFGRYGKVYKIRWIGAICPQKIFNNVNDMKFQRATSSLSTLSHPNVIPIYCGIIEKDEYSFVMEFMLTNLHKVMKKRKIENKMHPFSFSTAIDVLLQIAEGVLYLHDHDIVHSDLRPHNVLVNHVQHQDLAKESYVRVKLADFGLSKITNSSPLSGGDNIERIAYMAPESWEDNLRVGTGTWKAPNSWKDHPPNKKANVYSFGMMCHEVLTGCVPFPDVSDFEALANIISQKERPLLPKDCPESLKTLINNCWVHDPSCQPDFSNIVEQLRNLKQCTSFACSLYGESSSARITGRLEDAKGDTKARCLGFHRANSRKRAHDWMINDHTNFATSMEDIFFDGNKGEFPSLKFSRDNFGMKVCMSPWSEYEHVKGPPMTSLENEEMGLLPFEEPNEVSSLHLQFEEKQSHSSSMETNLAVTIEGEEDEKTMCKSLDDNIDMAFEDNAMDTNAQNHIESVEDFANISREKHCLRISSLEPRSLEPTVENVEDLVYENENQSMGVQECINSQGLLNITDIREEISSKNEDINLEAFFVEMMKSETEVLSVTTKDPNIVQSEYVLDEMAKEPSGLEFMKTNDETYEQSDIWNILPDQRFCVDQIKDRSWNALPPDLQEALLNKLDYKELTQVKLASKEVKSFIESDAYHISRGQIHTREASLSPLYFFMKDKIWQCSGFDLLSGDWKRLPALTFLPPPEEDLFKEYFVAGGEGLFCINVSKVPHEERVIVCNPLTQKMVELPPLNSRRNPVLMHMLVNSTTKSYKVIVAGSSGMEGGLSKCTEIFDSLTWKWTKTGDIPGPEFCLNEYQTGVYIDGVLYCIAFMDDGSGKTVSGKGVLAYNVDKGEWISDWKCPLPSPSCRHTNSIAQLLECNGELYLFLEREHGRHVDHCIEKFERVSSSIGKWKNVVKESKSGGRGLLVYPEYTCVPHGADKICIFNTIEHKGIVYDVVNGSIVKEISPPSTQLGEGFHSLNPLSFTFHPNFKD